MSVPHFLNLITSSYFNVYLGSTALLLTIMNPLGMLAVFMGMTGEYSKEERKLISIRSSIAILIILIIVTWIGTGVLKFFGVNLPAFEVAGGILLFLGSLPMVNSKKNEEKSILKNKTKAAELAIVPLAFPVVSGPAAILQVMICLHKFGNNFHVKLLLSLANLTAVLVLFLCFYFSDFFIKFISISGLKIIKIFIGIILLSIAVNIVSHGIIAIFHI
ncbi:MAG TPA: MarC family protein [Victivallales bacterium]|nr:MarC family protein [Victivallales bacterium]